MSTHRSITHDLNTIMANVQRAVLWLRAQVHFCMFMIRLIAQLQLEFLMFSPSESESLKVLFLFNKLNVQAVISFCNFLSWECDRWKQNWTWRTPDRRLSKKNRKYREHTHWHTDWWNPGNRGRRERERGTRETRHTHIQRHDWANRELDKHEDNTDLTGGRTQRQDKDVNRTK